jgi:hypothetical protein
MTLATRRRRRSPVSEEAAAAARLVLALSIAVGGMAAVMGAVSGNPIVLVALPALALAVAVARGAVPLAGWAGAAVWAALLPSADGEALLAPIAMIVLCLAIAIGPDRLSSWVGRDLAGSGARSPEGWIEEDGNPLE